MMHGELWVNWFIFLFAGGPGGYTVVKCGSSGHNIRCGPDLKATPTGMLVMSNQIVAVEEVSNIFANSNYFAVGLILHVLILKNR